MYSKQSDSIDHIIDQCRRRHNVNDHSFGQLTVHKLVYTSHHNNYDLSPSNSHLHGEDCPKGRPV